MREEKQLKIKDGKAIVIVVRILSEEEKILERVKYCPLSKLLKKGKTYECING